MNVTDLITQILVREGGDKFTNRASDRGGPTKYGITQGTLAASRGYAVTEQEVKDLTEVEARAIYRKRYVEDPGFGKITDERLQALLVDFGVTSGPGSAIMALQLGLGVMADGVIGPNTLNAINTLGPDEVHRRLLQRRMRFMVKIALNDPKVKEFMVKNTDTQLENLAGWVNRVLEFV